MKKTVPELKFIIDLNGNRASSILDKDCRKSKCEELGIMYKKIKCISKKIPSEELIEEFFASVQSVR